MKALLVMALLTLTFSVHAESMEPIAAGDEAKSEADVAADIFGVVNIKLGNLAYRIVSMDSGLNGDLNSTTILVVGQKEVGGLAGYESSFLLSPTKDGSRSNLISARASKTNRGAIDLLFTNSDNKKTQITVRYNPNTKKLDIR